MSSIPSGVLACRASWGRLGVIAAAGLRHVEVPLPAPSEVAAARDSLAAHGLAASSVHVNMDVRSDAGLARLAPAFAAVRELGAGVVFTSVHAGDAPRAAVFGRLRRVGDLAAEHGLVVALETHPDLATNGQVARETVEAVGHPAIRINFDTANVYYYNHDVDSPAELRKVAPYVASLHLKETTGGYHSFDFPALGRGVVDFPGVFRVLAESGFAGPLTLEIEGLRGADPEAEFAQVLRESLAYLAGLGVRPS